MRITLLSLAALALLGTAAAAAAAAGTFQLTSPAFKAGGMLADDQAFNGFGCSGKNMSPALHWRGAPSGAKSFALTVYDPDAPTGSGWWHWVVYNLPAGTTDLAAGAGAPAGKLLPAGTMQGPTYFGPRG